MAYVSANQMRVHTGNTQKPDSPSSIPLEVVEHRVKVRRLQLPLCLPTGTKPVLA